MSKIPLFHHIICPFSSEDSLVHFSEVVYIVVGHSKTFGVYPDKHCSVSQGTYCLLGEVWSFKNSVSFFLSQL